MRLRTSEVTLLKTLLQHFAMPTLRWQFIFEQTSFLFFSTWQKKINTFFSTAFLITNITMLLNFLIDFFYNNLYKLFVKFINKIHAKT